MARPALTARAQWLRITAALPAFVAVFFLGQGLLDQAAWRIDLTPEQRYTLSPYAQQQLAQVDQDVRVLAFLRSQDPRNQLIEDLLRQVRNASSRIRVERHDVNRSPALAREYGVDSYGAVVVECAGRRRVFGNANEDVLVAALLEVTRPARRVLGWSTGHGEGALDGTDRRLGYSSARMAIEGGHFAVRALSLLEGGLPDDVDVFAIVGPQKDFLPAELDALDRYLRAGRPLLVCLDLQQAPQLAARLGSFGIVFHDDVVVDPAARLYGGEALTLKAEVDVAGHPLSLAMGAGPLFSRARSVEVAPGATGSSLLWSSGQSWATDDVRRAADGQARFDPVRDRRGPLSLGVEAFTPVAAPGDGKPATTHVLAYGNAAFASNFFLDYLGNRDLLTNSVTWLARDGEGIGAHTARRTPGVQQFFLSEEQGAQAFWLSAVLQPTVWALVGLVMVARRRRG